MAKILIADDSTFMRNMLIDILSQGKDYEFIEAKDGDEVLRKFKIEKPDLILLDIVMPKLDGMEVLRNIGKIAKIIVVSSVGDKSIVKEIKELGAIFILKPFEEKSILNAVRKLLKSS